MEDFVPYKLAKKLNEKGFTLPKSNIIGKFDSDGVFHSQLYINFTETMDSEEIIAPTISQVLKWLRTRNIHIEPFLVNAETVQYKLNIMGWNGKFFCSIYNSLLEDANNKTITTYQSYEQVALAGIEYILDNNLI